MRTENQILIIWISRNFFDFAVKTPGIPKKLLSIPYTTATNLFFSQAKNIIIGVTGSKGKSTTASLIHSILKEVGYDARLLGNIGHPMLEALMDKIYPEEIFVVELSSYQLDDIQYFPDIAVVLNLFPEHMNYHGSVVAYYEAKKNIIKFQSHRDYFIFNGKDNKLKKWSKETVSQVIDFQKKDVEKIKSSLIGEHNKDNVRAAIAVAELFQIDSETVKKAIEKFEPLPHRLENVGTFRGVTFYDDAISTSPESTMMAIEALPNIKTIFLGGEDRGYDFKLLEKFIRKNKIENIVLFPDSGKRIFRSRKGLNVLETISMEEAVKFAFQVTPPGSICLLSTASPSYSLWKNFEEKGDQFQRYVKSLGK